MTPGAFIASADVLRPWRNGMDVTRCPADRWIVDFDRDMVHKEAALYKAPYRHAQEHVYPMRQCSRCESCRERWWRHVEPRQGMRRALPGALALHRDPDGGEAPAVRPARRAHLPRPSTDRHRPRRRHHLRHPAQPLPRGVVAAARHQPGRPPALHPDHHLRDLPVSAAGGANRSPVEPLFRPPFMLRAPPRTRRGCAPPC